MAEETLERVMTGFGELLLTKEEKQVLELVWQTDNSLPVQERYNSVSEGTGMSPEQVTNIMWSILGKIAKKLSTKS